MNLIDFINKEELFEAIKPALIEHFSQQFNQQLKDAVALALDSSVKEFAKEKLQLLLDNILDQEYTVKDRYGMPAKEPTTLRKELHSTIVSQMVFENKRSHYDQNTYTRTILDTADKKLDQFKKEFDTKVDGIFLQEAFKHAEDKLRQKFGIK